MSQETDINADSHAGNIFDSMEYLLRQRFDDAVEKLLNESKIKENFVWPTEYINKLIAIKMSQDPVKMCREFKRVQEKHQAVRLYDIVDEKGFQTLLLKFDTEGSVGRKIAPLEKLYDILKEAHLISRHGSPKQLLKILQFQQYFIPLSIIDIFCTYCKKPNQQKTAFSLNNTRYNIFETRGRVELINMEDLPDGEFKYILFYRDYFSCMTLLRPLMTKTIDEIALNLLNIFLELGCPIVLHSQLGEKFTTAIAAKIELVWPTPCKILNPRPELYAMTEQVIKHVKTVKERLDCWMAINDSVCWSIGVYFVQYELNSVQQGLSHDPFRVLINREKKLRKLVGEDILKMKTEDDLKNYLYCKKRKTKFGTQSQIGPQENKTTPTQVNNSVSNAKIPNKCGNVKLRHDYILTNKKISINKLSVAENLGLRTNIVKRSIIPEKTQPTCIHEIRVRIPKRKLAHETKTNQKISKTSVNENVFTLINESDCKRLIASRTHLNEQSSPAIKQFEEKVNIEPHKVIEKNSKIEQANNEDKCIENKIETVEKTSEIEDTIIPHKVSLNEIPLTNNKSCKLNNTLPIVKPLEKIDTITNKESSAVCNPLDSKPIENDTLSLIKNNMNKERPVTKTTDPKKKSLTLEISVFQGQPNYRIIKTNNESYETENMDTVDDSEISKRSVEFSEFYKKPPLTKKPLNEEETMKHQELIKIKLGTNKGPNENIGLISNDTDMERSRAKTTPLQSEHVELGECESDINRKTSQNDMIASDMNCKRPEGNQLRIKTNEELCEKSENKEIDLITNGIICTITPLESEHMETSEIDNELGINQKSSQTGDISGLIKNDINCKSPVAITTNSKNTEISSTLFEETEIISRKISIDEEKHSNSNSEMNDEKNKIENMKMYTADDSEICQRPVTQKRYVKSTKIPNPLKPLAKTESKVKDELIDKNKMTQTLLKIKTKMVNTDNIDLKKTQPNLKSFETVETIELPEEETIEVPEESIEEKCMWMLKNIKNKMAHEPKLYYETSETDNEKSKNEKNIVHIDDDLNDNCAGVDTDDILIDDDDINDDGDDVDIDDIIVRVDQSNSLNFNTANFFNGDDINKIYEANNVNDENIDCILERMVDLKK